MCISAFFNRYKRSAYAIKLLARFTRESREYFIKDCFFTYTGIQFNRKGATSSRCQVKCRDEEGYRIFNHSTEIKEGKNFQQTLDR